VKNFEKVISFKKRSVSKKDQFQKKISFKKRSVSKKTIEKAVGFKSQQVKYLSS